MDIPAILAKISMLGVTAALGELDLFHLSIALILVFVSLAIGKKYRRGIFKFCATKTDQTTVKGFIHRHSVPALKKCPNCAEELPLPALMCERCDYNFLSGRVGNGQKMLPAPNSAAQIG